MPAHAFFKGDKAPGPRSGRSKGPSLLFFLALILLSSGLLILIARRPPGDKLLFVEATEGLQPTPASGRSQSKPFFPVHIDGAVVNPGVHYFQEGDILSQAVEKAGGLTEKADQVSVNLAMRLAPHMKIYIPSQGQALPPIIQSHDQAHAKIDLNLANQAQLETLPGVGQVTAQAIIAYRDAHGPFESLEDLMQVPGIKEGRFAALRDSIYVTFP
ncbi:MAG TPA: ComEA family DNA-binding protein [Clostridia bacterium]|nr:ComEA family DNA-binding protein [Clostridia bacterium]